MFEKEEMSSIPLDAYTLVEHWNQCWPVDGSDIIGVSVQNIVSHSLERGLVDKPGKEFDIFAIFVYLHSFAIKFVFNDKRSAFHQLHYVLWSLACS